MSWLLNPSGDGPRAPDPTEELVEDPSDPSRKVRRKAANQPFLAYVRLAKPEAHSLPDIFTFLQRVI